MTPFDGKQPLLTISQAAAYLNVSKMTIRRWTNDGTLPCMRIGARKERRFLEDDLRKLVSGDASETVPAEKSPGLGGSHYCLVCEDANQEWNAIADAVFGRLSERSHIVFIGDTERRNRLRKVLRKREFDSRDLISTGALRLLSAEDSYLLSGSFSSKKAIAFVESTILDAFAKGFEDILYIGDVDWVFRGNGPNDAALLGEVMEYEKQLNRMLERYPAVTVLCPYVLDRVDAKTIVGALLAHPKLQFQAGVIDGLYS